jgi:4-hydroxy-tetrahydrodipicolinate reductase
MSTASPLRIGVFGASGRLGTRIVALASESADLRVVRALGRDTPAAEDLEGCDVVIDVAVPDATDDLMRRLAGARVPLVSGVTGRSTAQVAALEGYAERAPVLLASNFSVGVALLRRLVAIVGEAVPWEAEIFELHHRRKLDAPSGTALSLAQAVARARDLSWPSSARAPRGAGARGADEIGLAVARGGDVVGEHTVFFLGEAERLELTHRATDRGLFAAGALHAARWLANRSPGLYGMDDVVLGPPPVEIPVPPR